MAGGRGRSRGRSHVWAPLRALLAAAMLAALASDGGGSARARGRQHGRQRERGGRWGIAAADAYLLIAQPKAASSSLLATLEAVCGKGGKQLFAKRMGVTSSDTRAMDAADAMYAQGQLTTEFKEAPSSSSAKFKRLVANGSYPPVYKIVGSSGAPCPRDDLIRATGTALELLAGAEAANARWMAAHGGITGFAQMDPEVCASSRKTFNIYGKVDGPHVQDPDSCYGNLPHSDMWDVGLPLMDQWTSKDYIYKQHTPPSPRNTRALERVMEARGVGVGLLLRDPLASLAGYVRTMANESWSQQVVGRDKAAAPSRAVQGGARVRAHLPRPMRAARSSYATAAASGGATTRDQGECRDFSRRCSLFRSSCNATQTQASATTSAETGKRMYAEYNCRRTCGFCTDDDMATDNGPARRALSRVSRVGGQALVRPMDQLGPALHMDTRVRRELLSDAASSWKGSRTISVCRLANSLASLILWNEGWQRFAERHPDRVSIVRYADITSAEKVWRARACGRAAQR